MWLIQLVNVELFFDVNTVQEEVWVAFLRALDNQIVHFSKHAWISLYGKHSIMTKVEQNQEYKQCHSPVVAVYTPMYMVWVTFIESGITQW